MSEIKIRRAHPDDISEIFNLDLMVSALPWSERSYRFELSSNPSTRMWVLEMVDGSGSSIAGFLVLWFIIDEAHIANIAIHPDHRRKGFAYQLLVHGLVNAMDEGAEKCFLEVRRENVAAQALYNKLNFKTVGIRKRYYRDNREDAIIMSCDPLGKIISDQSLK
jgi:ribosomal-protein-alanine N-acetyltransferase